jgi:acyl-ACP thioesterase
LRARVLSGEGSASDESQSAEAGAKRRPQPTIKRGEGSASDESQSAEAGAKRRPQPTIKASRRFTGAAHVRLGDVTPKGRMRCDAIARALQDVANDDGVEAAGVHEAASWIVRRTRILAEQFPVFREGLVLTTWASAAGARWAERCTTIEGDRGGRVEARALWVYVDLATGRPRKLDPWFWEQYGESVGDRKVNARLTHGDPPGHREATTTAWPLRFADFDLVGHVNNAVYWAIVEECLDVVPGSAIEVEYRGGLDRGQDVSVLADGNALWIYGDDAVAATARVDQATA